MMNKMPYLCNDFSSLILHRQFVGVLCSILLFQSIKGSAAEPTQEKLPQLPTTLPMPQDTDIKNGYMEIKFEDGIRRKTTLIPKLQKQLEEFIHERNDPISAVVMVDVKTGNILALVQGRSPNSWGGTTHTVLHDNFPSASLFKTVVTAAAFEFAHLDPDTPEELNGGCAYVPLTGSWLGSPSHHAQGPISLRKAFGQSCNGFFAKIAIKRIGLGPIEIMANKLGWNISSIPADIYIPSSPIKFPAPQFSSASTVGKFAAGFGTVGMSPMHAAWQALIIANDGKMIPLNLLAHDENQNALIPTENKDNQVISTETAKKIREVMRSTVLAGTASLAFKHGAYREIKEFVGGKTGTLNGTSPRGLTTWFVGIMPIQNPEVVIASVVVLEDHWIFKAPNLGAEALLTYTNIKGERPLTASTSRAK